MEGDKPYKHVFKMVNFVSMRAQRRIRSIQQTARFVEIISNEQNFQLKRGAVHTIIPSCQVSVKTNISSNFFLNDFQLAIGFFKNRHGKNGVVIDPLDIRKQFKSCESGTDYAAIRFEGKSLRKHSAYANLDTTGPIYEIGTRDKQNLIELHDDNKNVGARPGKP